MHPSVRISLPTDRPTSRPKEISCDTHSLRQCWGCLWFASQSRRPQRRSLRVLLVVEVHPAQQHIGSRIVLTILNVNIQCPEGFLFIPDSA